MKDKQSFSPLLAWEDALPVVLFGAAMIVIAARFASPLFRIGAGLSTLAGTGKVLWKLMIAYQNKDIPLLAKQMRFTMPTGFSLIAASLIRHGGRIAWGKILHAALSFPSVLFVIAVVGGLGTMTVLGIKMDQHDVKSNRIEQAINTVVQGSMLGIVLSVIARL